MKLLIVDDEPHIVDWIYDLMRDECPELAVYRAYSGVQALTTLSQERIDILMTDIRMPRMSGLELMEAVRKSQPRCRILFLTGFGEFDYVYTAIQQRGVRYLLKTEDDAVIVRTIREMMDELRQEEDESATHARADRRNKALNALVRGRAGEEDIKLLGFNKNAPMWIMYIRAVDGAVAVASLDETLSDVTKAAILPWCEGDAVILTQGAETLQDMKGEAQRLFDALFSDRPSLEISICPEPLSLKEASSPAVDWIRCCAGTALTGGVIVRERHLSSQGKPDPLAHQRRLNLLRSMELTLSRGERESYLSGMDSLIDSLRLNEWPDDQACRQTYFTLAAQLMTRSVTVESFDQFPSWPAAFDYLKDAASALLSENGDTGQEDAGLIRQLTAYIEEHLGGDLSLARLSEVTHYSPSYISRAFKQQMNVNLNNYIIQARVRRAAVMLSDTEKRVTQVAGEVGFNDTRYFSKLFQQHMGVLPQHYRGKHQK